MCSRYVGQLGRYAGQSTHQLAHIQTYEVAMQASQALIHSPSRSLCVHPSRYIPSGAHASGSARTLQASLWWAASTNYGLGQSALTRVFILMRHEAAGGGDHGGG